MPSLDLVPRPRDCHDRAREEKKAKTCAMAEPRSDGTTMDTEGLENVSCPMCTFEVASIPIVLSHLRPVHSSDPHCHAICGIDGCSHKSMAFPALYSHI